MSEEEKKAIEQLKHNADSMESDILGIQRKTLKMVLNLIEKQQKEIEKYEQQIDLEFVEKNFIEKNKVVSKDKIREYFEHDIAFKKRLQREKQKIDEYNKGRFDTIENILELLEEK